MFHHLKNNYDVTLKERRVNHKRHYETPHGKLYRSVTTVMSILSKEAIDKWREDVGEAKADYIIITSGIIGTQFHDICEDYLRNNSLTNYQKLIPLAHFNNIKHYLDKIDNIEVLEAGVYSDKYQLAGRVDCIAEYDGVPSIIDFKTSKKEKPEEWILNYFCQTTAYREAWLERTKDKIDQIVIIMSGLDGSKTIYKKNPDDYIEDLKKTIILYEESLKDNG